MRTNSRSSFFDRTAWHVYAIPVQGPRKLIESHYAKCEAVEAARALNHAAPWVFHDVRRSRVASDPRKLCMYRRTLGEAPTFPTENTIAF